MVEDEEFLRFEDINPRYKIMSRKHVAEIFFLNYIISYHIRYIIIIKLCWFHEYHKLTIGGIIEYAVCVCMFPHTCNRHVTMEQQDT